MATTDRRGTPKSSKADAPSAATSKAKPSRANPSRATPSQAGPASERAPAAPPPPTALTFEAVPTPSLDAMPALLRSQLGPLLEQALDDGPDGLSLLTCFAVRRGGDHAYDLALFAGDDGAVYRAGTLERVASFSQGGATGSEDAALVAALDSAYAAWRSKGAAPAPPSPPPVPRRPAEAPSGELPRYSRIHGPDRQVLGKKLDAGARSGLVRIERPPTPAELEALAAYLAPRAAGFVVELGPAVPLSVLGAVGGVPFVVLAAGRKSWDGLDALPASVRRLSIRRPGQLSLAALPPTNRIASLELDVPRMPPGSPALANLESVGWTGAEDLSWLEAQPALRELALRNAKVTRLFASRSLERLLLYKPRGLRSLDGIEALPRLRYLRIDHPADMQRLGDLAACRALTTIHLTAAHRLGDLSDLAGAPALELLGVVQTQLDGKPFEALKGKLKGGGFQLKSNTHTRALAQHLGIPFVKTNELEGHFFDEP